MSLLGALPSLGNRQSYITVKVQETVTLLPIPAVVQGGVTPQSFGCSLAQYFQKCILSLCSCWPIALPGRSIIQVVTSFLLLSLKSSNVTSN